MNDTFVTWLLAEIDERGWSYTETARRGEISHARISQVAAGDKPGETFCKGIARAFNMPPEDVFRRAGLLPSESAETRAKRAIRHLAEQMSDEELDLWNDIGRALLERRNRQTD